MPVPLCIDDYYMANLPQLEYFLDLTKDDSRDYNGKYLSGRKRINLHMEENIENVEKCMKQGKTSLALRTNKIIATQK